MKVICSKSDLTEGINTCQKAVSSKTTLPVLEGILLEASNEFKMTGNDLEIGIECLVSADIRKEGSIVINAKMFGDIVRRLPDSEVMIEVKDNNLVVIECENSHFEIKGLQPSGFPALPQIEKENIFRMSQKMLRDMIRQTIFAVSMDENRAILTGSLIECKNGEITFVSIDGFRLALRRSVISNNQSELNVVIPGKTLNEIAKILEPEEKEISIYSTKSQIMFDIGRCKVVSRLLEGEYMNYAGIIPQENETKVKVKTKELLQSIERASLIITSEERRYPVRFDIKEDKIILTSNTDVGAVKEEIRIDMKGNDLDIGFNPRYFIDALRVIDDEEIDLMLTTSVGPCTITPVDGNAFAYLILPVRK